jgi:hypothetical protein
MSAAVLTIYQERARCTLRLLLSNPNPGKRTQWAFAGKESVDYLAFQQSMQTRPPFNVRAKLMARKR